MKKLEFKDIILIIIFIGAIIFLAESIVLYRNSLPVQPGDIKASLKDPDNKVKP